MLKSTLEFCIGHPEAEQMYGEIIIETPMGIQHKPTSELLCTTNVPTSVCAAEYCRFLSKAEESIREVRIAKSNSQSTYLVLIRCVNKDKAYNVLEYINNKKYSVEPAELSKVGYIVNYKIEKYEKKRKMSKDQISVETQNTTQLSLFSPENSQSCAICLEKIGQLTEPKLVRSESQTEKESFSLSILCGHYYHWKCIDLWKDDTCPLCRYIQNPGETNCCEVCAKLDHLLACLICGFIGCSAHSKQHYVDSMHTYAINIETKNVWDYAKEGYVHRLIHNSIDNKIVEINDPETTEILREVGSAHIEKKSMKSYIKKMESLNNEYNLLLLVQLDTQKKYYEDILRKKEEQLSAASLNQENAVKLLKDRQNLLLNEEISLKEQYEKELSYEESIKKETEEREQQTAKMEKDNKEMQSKKQILESMFNNNRVELEKQLAAEECKTKQVEEDINDALSNLKLQKQITKSLKGEEISNQLLFSKDPKRKKQHK